MTPGYAGEAIPSLLAPTHLCPPPRVDCMQA